MALNQVQIDFSNNTTRPFLETLIQMVYVLEAYRDDYDALQASPDALPVDGSNVLDNADGTAPRSDAPILQYSDQQTLRNIADNMSAQLGGAAKVALIGKMKRDLNSVIRIGTR